MCYCCRGSCSYQCGISNQPLGVCEGRSYKLRDWTIFRCGGFGTVPRCQIYHSWRISGPICLSSIFHHRRRRHLVFIPSLNKWFKLSWFWNWIRGVLISTVYFFLKPKSSNPLFVTKYIIYECPFLNLSCLELFLP